MGSNAPSVPALGGLCVGERMKFAQALKSVFLWKERQRVFHQISSVPIPLLISFTQANRPGDLKLLRLIMNRSYLLPADFVRSALAFGIKPSKEEVIFPKKTGSEPIPLPFTARDEYWRGIADRDPRVANEIREQADIIPKGIKKRREPVNKWV